MADTFPANKNKFLEAVETLAIQNIKAVRNSNTIEDAFREYPVVNGEIIEEALIKMADGKSFAPVAEGASPDLSPLDPKLAVRYFGGWEALQYKTTLRYDEIHKILTSGKTADDVAAEIDSTLTEGEGFTDYGKMRKIIEEEAVTKDCSTDVFGSKHPKNMKGVIAALRIMYNKIRATNSVSDVPFAHGVDADNIRIAISYKALAYIDIVELANVFNMSKEDILGKLVVLPDDENYDGSKVLVYDVSHLGRGTRIYEYAQEDLKTNRYVISTLNTEKTYFADDLFKALGLDISAAITAAEGDLFA